MEDPGIEGRLRRIEEQMESISDDVKNVGELVAEFVADVGNLRQSILEVRRLSAEARAAEMASNLRHWTEAQQEDGSMTDRVAKSCMGLLGRRLAALTAELRYTDDPEPLVRRFRKGMEDYLTELLGFSPFDRM